MHMPRLNLLQLPGSIHLTQNIYWSINTTLTNRHSSLTRTAKTEEATHTTQLNQLITSPTK